METIYIRIESANGHKKFVKTDLSGCEIILITPYEKRHQIYKNPYPVSGEENYEIISKAEYDKALEIFGIKKINNNNFIKIPVELLSVCLTVDEDIKFIRSLANADNNVLSLRNYNSVITKLNLIKKSLENSNY